MAMTGPNDRWALPDLASALRWCRKRNAEGIRCTLDVLGENARDEVQAARSVEAYLSCARAIEEKGLDASISVKLTDLGALFDRQLCQENLRILAKQAKRCGVGFEIDVEGRPLVEFTVKAALDSAAEGPGGRRKLRSHTRGPEDLAAEGDQAPAGEGRISRRR
jgi:proline dehydrogenase